MFRWLTAAVVPCTYPVWQVPQTAFAIYMPPRPLRCLVWLPVAGVNAWQLEQVAVWPQVGVATELRVGEWQVVVQLPV